MPDNMNQKQNSSMNSKTRFGMTSSSLVGKPQTKGKKSKYSQKYRSKKNVKPGVKPRGPIYTYTATCCSAPATKPACVQVDKKKALEQGLGSWRCAGCHKPCKCTVSKFKPAESISVVEA